MSYVFTYAVIATLLRNVFYLSKYDNCNTNYRRIVSVTGIIYTILFLFAVLARTAFVVSCLLLLLPCPPRAVAGS